jgi:hypothetical protein
MKRQSIVRAVMTGMMTMALIIPVMAGAAEQGKKKQVPVLETSKITMGSEAIKQEVIQVLRKGEMSKVILNIAGQPGVYYKVEYSETGAEGSYALVPKGQGVIGSNGFGSVSFDLGKLGTEEVYIQVTTSDSADFTNSRVTPRPLVLMVEQVKLTERGWKEKVENWAAKEKAVIKHRMEKFEPRTPSAVTSVRG